MNLVDEYAELVGIRPACETIGVSRATFYRNRRQRRRAGRSERVDRPSPRALKPEERESVLAVLHSPRFVDTAPAEIYATLLDEGEYQCSVSTMYRILWEADEVRDRRNQARRPNYAKPELLATGPNQVWSWDITKLLGPRKWTYYYLYVILDIFSRHVVGWMIAERESATLGKRLISETVEKEGVSSEELTLHADRGSSMRSKLVAQLLGDLGVTKTHSRPYVSNDNPYSESQFKTMKYRPEFPSRFGSLEDATTFGRSFFRWYNTEHRHSSLGYMTPESVHRGTAEHLRSMRQQVLEAAANRHPERFVRGTPVPPRIPTEAWINTPCAKETTLST